MVLSTRSIADWLKPPDTWFLLDFIKPEFLLLRVGAALLLCVCERDHLFFNPAFLSQTLARCLIMWDEILPNTEWVKSNIPQVRKYTHTHRITELPCFSRCDTADVATSHYDLLRVPSCDASFGGGVTEMKLLCCSDCYFVCCCCSRIVRSAESRS